jgi:hypothetical protein
MKPFPKMHGMLQVLAEGRRDFLCVISEILATLCVQSPDTLLATSLDTRWLRRVNQNLPASESLRGLH